MVKKLNLYVFSLICMIFAACICCSGVYTQSKVFADNNLSDVFWGGQVTNELAEKGSIENPASSFDEAKSLLSENGTIWINGTVSISGNNEWQLSSSQIIKRYDNFTGVMFSLQASSSLTLSNVTIDGNQELQSVGSIFKTAGSNINLIFNSGTVLQNNYSTTRGGAVWLSSASNLTINGAIFKNNTSEQQGGAICLSYGSVVTFNEGVIQNNSAKYGGAIYCDNGLLEIYGGQVINNVAKSFTDNTTCGGGGIYASASFIIGGNPIIENNITQISVNENTNSDIYIVFGKSIMVATPLQNTVPYNVLVSNDTSSLSSAVILSPYQDVLDASIYFNNFNFVSDIYTFSVGVEEFSDSVLVNKYVTLTFYSDFNQTSSYVKDNVSSGQYLQMPSLMFNVPGGFVFKGWSTNIDEFVDVEIDAQYYVVGPQTFYAIYQKEVVYNPNGGTGNVTGAKTYGLSFVSSNGQGFSRKGYTLVGWGTSPSTTSSDVEFYALGSVINDSVLISYNYTLYAVWEIQKHNVIFDSCGGQPVEMISVSFGAQISLPYTSKLGYKLVGWFKQNDDGSFYDVEFDFNNETMPDENLTLYARWLPLFENSETYITDKVFKIANVEQLNNLSLIINNGEKAFNGVELVSYNNLSYQLINNLSFSETNVNNFIPIGNASNCFSGVFDGKLYTISNININNNFTYAGIFGVLNNATIKNLIIENSVVLGVNSVGGIAGQSTNSFITNCVFVGEIEGSSSNGFGVGGLVGNASYGTIIESCFVKADIESKNNAGGLVGNLGNAKIVSSVAFGSIVAKDKCGGLVGFVDNNSILEYSYFTGNVCDTSLFYGSIVGYNLGTINNCYFTYETSYVGGINNVSTFGQAEGVKFNQFLSLDNDVFGEGLRNQWNELVNNNGIKFWQAKAKLDNFAYLPIPCGFNSILDNYFAVEVCVVTFNLSNQSETDTWVQYVKKDSYAIEPVNKTISNVSWYYGDNIWCFVLNKVTQDITLDASITEGVSYFENGSGTIDDPYQISTYQHFVMFTNLINNLSTSNLFVDKYYILTNDIDCTDKIVLPVGNLNVKFMGVFDGNNHKIINANVKITNDYAGLFVLNGGVIKNVILQDIIVDGNNVTGSIVAENFGIVENIKTLKVKNGKITGNNYVGGIVGYNSGIVKNCTNNIEVVSNGNYVGGIVGCMKLQSSIVENCINYANVVAENYVAGIVGYAYFGSVQVCFNSAVIEGRYAGGIVGYSNICDIKYAVNAGQILGSSYLGGLVAKLNQGSTLTTSYSVGQVLGNEYVGDLVGLSDGIITYCYYEKNIYSVGAVNGKDITEQAVGLPVGLMLTKTTNLAEVFDVNFINATLNDTNVWIAQENVDNKWYYPILTPLYSQLILTYYQTNFIQVELNYYANVTQTELKQNTLILPLGLSVSYILPYYFEFLGIDANNENSLSWYSDSTYENPVFIIGSTTNVLFAEWQISFEGEGNENSPYLITNSYDLILLSSLINSASLNQFYATKVYKLTSNIDLSNFQFTPIGLYPSLPFKGVFLGNNKTISGVYINLPNYSNVGLFGYTTNAKITNLYLTDVFVEAYSIVGGLIGKADNCDVLNCVIEVSVQCYNDNAGALIGMMLNTRINSCAGLQSMVSAQNIIGGLVGFADNLSEINNCQFNGIVDGFTQVGGIVGFASKTKINASYTVAIVQGVNEVGGIVGLLFNNSKITQCFVVQTVIGVSYVGGVVGKSVESETYNCYFNIERNPNLNAVSMFDLTSNNVAGVSTIFMMTKMFEGTLTTWYWLKSDGNRFYYPTQQTMHQLGFWCDEVVQLEFETYNAKIYEFTYQLGYVLVGANYNFGVVLNTDRNYDLSTLLVGVVKGNNFTVLKSNENGYYSVEVTEPFKIVVAVSPVKYNVVVNIQGEGKCDKQGVNTVEDGTSFVLNFVPAYNNYVKSILINNKLLENWTNESCEIIGINSNSIITVVFSSVWEKREIIQDNCDVTILADEIYYDAKIEITKLTPNDDLLKEFKKATKGSIISAFSFESNSSSENIFNSDATIKIYIGTFYNNDKISVLIKDGDNIKTLSTTVDNGYVLLNASQLRTLAIVKESQNYTLIWLTVFVVVAVLIFITTVLLSINRKGVLSKNSQTEVDTSVVNLDNITRRNNYCKNKPPKAKSVSLINGTQLKNKKTSQNILNEEIDKINKEKKFKSNREKLGKKRKPVE